MDFFSSFDGEAIVNHEAWGAVVSLARLHPGRLLG